MSVSRSVGPLGFSAFSSGICVAQMLDLAFFITAPAHPHATSVAMYTALFFVEKKKKEFIGVVVLSGYIRPHKSCLFVCLDT